VFSIRSRTLMVLVAGAGTMEGYTYPES
jgi:hypothetical protein